ncbi:MAG TPA: hypothetical protein PLC15_23035 [Candidatus Obscuribacter sp.]|mgnify:CR=1 FL=1|nr:hypothetical protein [Candidatus Obscuribacter sp.]HMY04267.1 hypothetical protein [Candidatus Obscuribacter sp.]HMY54113.1 hypothetical protein [Candidatus Obscuribacter sp.]HNB18282.1 hypothetical protein [Candidatus Obscuribacter sp.]HND06070.1 hypothetical protein [Candidatus Obscuribacter sp.]
MSKNNTPTISLEEMVSAVQAMTHDPQLLKLYDEGDKVSASQTKHDVAHAYSVLETAQYLKAEVMRRFPDLLDQLAAEVVIPAGAFLHDIGRAVSVDDHAGAGKVIALQYLSEKGFPHKIAGRVAAVVACHRSDDFLKISVEKLRKFPELAIVVIADKCVGDEDRVRPGRAFALKVFRTVGLARVNWWHNAPHDRVNFAIKKCELFVDSDDAPTKEHAGAIVLKLSLDERVAPASELLSLYARRFHSCGRGAKSLGFVFRIEVNGVRYCFNDDKEAWLPLAGFNVPLP